MRQDVEYVINQSKIDEAKLPKAMEIIEKAAEIMEEKDCDADEEAKEELVFLQDSMRELTGKQDFAIEEVSAYWSYTSLETIAALTLMQKPHKCGLSEETLRELIEELLRSQELEEEATLDYWSDFFEVETEIEEVMDYFYDIDDSGEIEYASIDEIMERIKKARTT